ncbi:hypothetical protein Tco_1403666 [Tanacetum coccineum]
MSKGKKDKNRVFVVNLKHDGIFSPYPFSYIHGDEKQLTDFDFEGMSYDNLRELVRKMVHSPVVNLYVEHHGYDPIDYKNSNDRDYDSPDSSDAYCSSNDKHVIDYVDFYHEGEQGVVVKNITTNDPFLTKLCSNNGNFRGFINEPILVNEDLQIENPDSSSLEPTHQIQRGIAYPRHDPLQPWNEMQPILGMRYDHPEQLKLALANYGVAGGYQLWFQKNDWRQLLVYCGRDVSTGRCAGYFSKKVKAKKQLFTESHDDANKGKKPTKKQLKKGNLTFKVGKVKTRSCKVGEGTSKEGEGSSRNSDVSPKWTKSKIASSRKSGQPQCGFRLWASWMSTENSFQIKSLKAEHKCARNYNLGSLVTYKWIAHHFAKEIIEDPFMPLLKMKAAMREKFLINVSLGQCKRAKQRALYDFEGGLIEHYARESKMVGKEQLPKPPQMKKQPGRNREPNFNSYASNRGGGRGSRGGRSGRGIGRGVTTMLVDEEKMNEEEIRKNMKHEYMEQILIEKEEKRIAAEKAIQEEFDKEAVRLTLEEEARYEKENQEKIREDEDSEYNQMWYNHGITLLKSTSTKVECGTAYVQTQESIAQPSVAATETTPRGKTIEADVAEPPKLKKQGRKRKVAEPSAAEPPFRIYHKNRGRSERIFNQKMKKTGFGPNGEGSTADKAFSL